MRHKMFLLDNPGSFFKKVRLACPEILRHSWKPEKTTSPSRPPNIATKFGGSTPWVSDDWKWPSCAVCHKFMSFLCQINLCDMPTEMKERITLADGLFQCFYCIECSGFSNCFDEVRIVPQEAIEVNTLRYLSAVASKDQDVKGIPVHLQNYVKEINKIEENTPNYRVFKEQFVGSWSRNPNLEVPKVDEFSEDVVTMAKLGMEPDDMWCIDLNPESGIEDDSDNYYESDIDELDEGFSGGAVADAAAEVLIRGPSGGIKLGGYIDWVQGVEYPSCPVCPERPVMDVVLLQLEEDSLLDFMWGDTGVAHITLCPSCHKPGLGWACS